MIPKEYIKNIEDENFILRKKIEELDLKVREMSNIINDIPHQISMTLSIGFTDGLDNFFTEIESLYTCEDNAISDVGFHMCTILNPTYKDWKNWKLDKIKKYTGINLYPKWNIEYWYFGLMFMSVYFTLHKKKRNFIKVFVSDIDMNRFKYTIGEENVDKIDPYIHRKPEYYKKKLYSYINKSPHKDKFTPYK